MRRLYLKIVVAIWVVMIVSSVGAGLIIRTVAEEEAAERLRAMTVDRILLPAVEDVLTAAEGEDREQMLAMFRSSRLVARKIVFTLQDADGETLLAVGPSEATAALLSGNAGEKVWRHEFVHGASDYVLQVLPRERQRRGPPGVPFRPWGLLLILVIAIPLSVFLSMLVARYLIRPLKSFELAGLRLADGDLSARINPSVAARGDELAEFATTFDHMAERIEKLVSSHKELLRDVSHELRSPLARVHAALSLARQRTKGAVDDELNRVETELDRLDSLIGRLLVFARLDAGQLQTQRQPIDLAGLLLDVVGDSQIEAAAEDKKVVLADGPGFDVVGDPGLLASCFENVIRNAIRHSPPRSSVDVALFSEAGDAGRCFVSVRDRGEGVPEDRLSTIFELFRKYDDDGGENTGSAGIGLAIAEKVVTLHGGGISAANAPDGGLVVTVWLPVAYDTLTSHNPS